MNAARIRAAERRVAHHLLARVTGGDMLHAPCESRALESVLAFRVLDRNDALPDIRERVRRYLRRLSHDEHGDAEQRLLASIALQGARGPIPDLVPEFRHFTAERKRVLLATVFHAIGARAPVTWPGDEVFDTSGLQSWKRAEVTACKAILAAALGRREQITAHDLALLASTGERRHHPADQRACPSLGARGLGALSRPG